MSRCPITYEPLSAGERYSREGLRRLSPQLKSLHDLDWSAEEQRREAIARASKMSIAGLQPKLSTRLNIREGRFEFVDTGGAYILKPQIDLPEVPENESLTMKLAALSGIEVPVTGLVRSADGTWTYFIRRFDREPKGRKMPVEDFAQLSGASRDTKYESSMERVAEIVSRFCTFPVVEMGKLFRLTLFNFLTGNEDAHLKNFSMITRGGVTGLSPAYDLLNTTIVLPRSEDEIALPLGGKMKNLTRSLFMEYYGAERLGLGAAAIGDVVSDLARTVPAWTELIEASFLSGSMKKAYRSLIESRRKTLGL